MTKAIVRNQKLQEKLKHLGLGSIQLQMQVQEYPETQSLLGSVP